MATLLIVDDEEPLRSLWRDMLEEAGYEVLEAEDGHKGLAVLDATTVDLVITDILMPDKEGIETIREIRSSYPDVKIIAVSGGGATGNLIFLEMARKFGAQKALAKPIGIDEFYDAIETVLSLPSESGQRPG